MIMSTMAYCSVRCANSQSTDVVRSTSTVSIFCSFVCDLIKGRENIIGKLNFCNRRIAFCCCSDSESDDALLGERGVEDTVRAVAFSKTDSAAKDTTKGNVLSKNKRPGKK